MTATSNGVRERGAQAGLAVGGHVHGKARLAEALCDERGEGRIVLDEQRAHRVDLSAPPG